MYRSDWEAVLDAAGSAALDHLNSLPDRPVYPQGSYPEILAALDHPPTETGVDAAQVVHELARDLGPYVTAHASGRYFGFVIGGLHPASWGAEILVSTWDQNAGLFPPTPGVAVAEELAGAMAPRHARPALRELSRLRHRWADGHLHLPGRRPPRGPCVRPAGTSKPMA